MLSDNKLDNYKNIQASVKKLTDEKTKQNVITVLSDFSDEKLQKIDSHKNIIDLMLQDIQSKEDEHEYSPEYLVRAINRMILDRSDNQLNRIENNRQLFSLFLKEYRSDQIDELTSLNDERFAYMMKNTNFIKALCYIGPMHQDFLDFNSDGSVIKLFSEYVTDEVFNRCMDNKDLILVYCCLVQSLRCHFNRIGTNVNDFRFRKFMSCTTRNNMIDQIYSFHKICAGQLNCSKKTLDLILLNLPIVEQLIYNDVDDNVIKTLKCDNSSGVIQNYLKSHERNDLTNLIYDNAVKAAQESHYNEVSNLLKSIQREFSMLPTNFMHLPIIQYPESNEPEKRYYSKKENTLQELCISKITINNYTSLKQSTEAKLDNAQIAQAIPNEQNIAQQ